MGIRYDRDSRRATNGPMIFFTDPSSEMAVAEEIRGALISGLSFYCYRGPGESMISFGSSEGVVEGVGTPGYVIGMFNPSLPILTIPYKGCKNNLEAASLYEMPAVSTSREEYFAEVQEIIKILNGNCKSKIVAARVSVTESRLDLGETFFDFCKRFPDSYIFCFGTPATGCWIGASPELLLESSKGFLKTMALAGTRAAYSEGDWDEKNREEQRIVTDYIIKLFKSNNLMAEEGNTFTKVTGEIEHICTPITASLPSYLDLNSLLKSFSPTPALCGYPKEKSLETIESLEHFARGCYGGFCGPYHSPSDFSFNVVIRCGSVSRERYCLYAGGGITSKSSPEEEWDETEAKLRNILPTR